MKGDRLTRVNELLRREIGLLLPRVMREEFDAAAVTVTRVTTTSDLRSARVLVSILGHEQERARMVSRLQGAHAQFQEGLNRTVRLKYTPRLHFVLDLSIEQGDRVLDLLSKLDPPPGPGTARRNGSVHT